MIIVPTILTDNPGEARSWLEELKKDGRYSRVQIDFIDGKYANNRTIMPEDVDLTPFLQFDFDAHLMVVQKNVENYVRQTEKTGFDRIIVQMESVSDPEKYPGLALDIHSPIAAIESFLPKLEVVTIMSIEPGFGGQEFINEAIEKIVRLNELRGQFGYKYKIQVDGGVQKEHLEILEKAGADEAAAGAKKVLDWK